MTKSMTQAKRVLEHLKKHGTITVGEAHSEYGIRHLPARIRDIKKYYDIPIYDTWQDGVNRFNEKCRYKVYSINEQQKSKG